MIPTDDYMELTRECLALAETEADPKRRKALLDIAKLYTQSALDQNGATPDKPQGVSSTF